MKTREVHSCPDAADDSNSPPEVFHRRVLERRSLRAFAPRAVAPGVLRALFEAARWAPSSVNEQPWRFIVATRAEPEPFARLLATLHPGNAAWAAAAPVLAISIARLEFERNGRPNRHAFHDVGLATAQLGLQAAVLGLGVHLMGGFDRDRARATLDIPAVFDPVAAIALGYPGDPDTLPEPWRERERAVRTRRPLAESVFGGRWGEPATAITAAEPAT